MFNIQTGDFLLVLLTEETVFHFCPAWNGDNRTPIATDQMVKQTKKITKQDI